MKEDGAQGKPTDWPAVGPEVLMDILRETGYRANTVEHQGKPLVHSAVQGLQFQISLGNASPADSRRFIDFTFHCILRVQGELPALCIEEWNRTRRFARISAQGQALVLSMDVMVAGGVSKDHLRAQCELWDHLMRQFLVFLQQPAPAKARANAS